MKYLKLFEQYNKITNYGDYKLGDKVEVNWNLEMYPLPDSNGELPDDGVYELKYIPIDKTDISIKGQDKRSEFDHDDYDDYQTNTFKYMTDNFDSLPPIIFIEKQDGTYSHIDGHHRIIIAKELGKTEILAWIHTLDQSKEKVVNKPDPKFTIMKKDILFLLRTNTWNDDKHIFFYKDEILVNKKEFTKKIHQSDKVEDFKIMDRKFLPYL